MSDFMIVSIAGGASFAAVALCIFGLALCWDPKFGYSHLRSRKGADTRRAFGGKAENRFDASLFLWTMMYLVGSAVWLRSITNGDQFGRGITYPMWKANRPDRFFATDFFHPLSDTPSELRPRVEGFNITVDSASCNYTTQADFLESPRTVDYCGDTNPQVSILATVDSIVNVRQGLVVTIHSSSDFKRWSQASTPKLPRDMIVRDGSLEIDSPTPLNDVGASLPNTTLGVATSACFGTPGAYYVVGCLRQGVPPPPPRGMPVCSEPPCEGAIGPPFSTCLAIATACVSTCDTISTETLTPPLCTAGGEIDLAAIERYSRPLQPLDPMFVAFIGCYTVGLIFFFTSCGMMCCYVGKCCCFQYRRNTPVTGVMMMYPPGQAPPGVQTQQMGYPQGTYPGQGYAPGQSQFGAPTYQYTSQAPAAAYPSDGNPYPTATIYTATIDPPGATAPTYPTQPTYTAQQPAAQIQFADGTTFTPEQGQGAGAGAGAGGGTNYPKV